MSGGSLTYDMMPRPDPRDRAAHRPAGRLDTPPEPGDDAVIGRAFRWSLLGIAVLAAGGGAAAYFATREPAVETVERGETARVERRVSPAVDPPRVPFTDVTAAAGIDFVHESGAAGEKLLPETMGGGGGFFDFDSDGDPDLLLVNSTRWPWDEAAGDAAPATCRLYENDGTGHFTDVTAGSGFDVPLYGMGCAFGDYDADGDPDVYLTALGPNRLLRNDGANADGRPRFTDVTDETGTAGGAEDWTTGAGWFDADGDGDLDLLAVNYVEWSREYDLAQPFTLVGGGRGYGRPQAFAGTFPLLFRNPHVDGGKPGGEEGGREFGEVAEESGLHVTNPATGVPLAKSLGLTFCDADGDGRPDVFVANDTVRNFLFLNTDDGFEEVGELAGVAYDENGMARGAMGVDAARLRGGGDLAIAVGNFSTEMTALYVSPADALTFTDEAVANGLGPQTRLELTFAVLFLDADLDGRPDLLCANGHLEDEINRVQPAIHYAQNPQLFWNAGPDAATEFVPLGADAVGEDFRRPLVGRGASYADIDADGDPDVLLCAVNGPARLLRIDQSLGHHWLRVRCAGGGSNPDAVGARVTVVTADGEQTALVNPTRGYLSQVELPLTFGLGERDRVGRVVVRWPDGGETVVDDPGVNRELEVRRD